MPASQLSRWRALTAFCLSLAVASAILVVAPGQRGFAVGMQPPAAPSAPPLSLAALKAEVAATGERLATATAAWERGQTALGVLIQRKISSGRTLEQLHADAADAQKRISALASSLYRSPVDPMVTVLLSGDVHNYVALQYVRRALRQTSTDQREALALLTNRAADATAQLRTQDELAAAATRLQAGLDEELSRLQADAQASLLRFQQALAEIERRKQAAAAAARLASQSGGGATCSGEVPVEAINGFLPEGALCALRSAPGQRLVAPAAAAFDAMSDAFARTFGKALCVTDSYRSYPAQVQVFRTKPSLAAIPGRSQHGWGRAVDLCGGVQTFGTPAYEWLKQHAAEFGYKHPDWAEPNGSRPEPWHWEFQA